MSRPDPIQYAERLYAAIRAANFSPISFLAFGSAVKDGVDLRRMPRIAAEPFMRVVGEMLDLQGESPETEVIDAGVSEAGLVAGAKSSQAPSTSVANSYPASGVSVRRTPSLTASAAGVTWLGDGRRANRGWHA